MSKPKRQAEPESEAQAEPEPTAKLYGMWLVPGQGWRTVCVELPRSLVELYATEITDPDLRAIATGRLVQKLDADAYGGRS